MGRGMQKVEKTTDIAEETVKEVKETVTEQATNSNEIDALKRQIELLQAMVLNNVSNNSNNNTSSYDDGYIRSDKSIQVMSLTPHLLNLSTQPNGKGKLFQFFKFGETKSIIYSDLSDILIACYDKAEKGAFYIFDKDVVSRHGLGSAYTKILNKEAIDGFLENSTEDVKKIFSELSDLQKEAVATTIIEKIVAGEDVSTNKVTAINKIYGEDLFEKADEMMNWEKEVQELENEK